MPRRGRRTRGFTVSRYRRRTLFDRGRILGQRSAATADDAQNGDSASDGASESNSIVHDETVPETTSRIGGTDIDRDRPSKVARLTPIAQRPRYVEAMRIGYSNDSDHGDSQIQEEGHSLQSTPSTDELALGNLVPVVAYETEDNASEAAKDTIEPPLTASSTPKKELPVVKRPKGWHLRRENRDLRQTVLQGSPIRSERQDSIDTQDANGFEPATILRKLPGRRRAPHADPDIEADMRRQLELKIAYRAVVKCMKPILMELAMRTQDCLEEQEHAHEEFEEYQRILTELDARLKNRIAIINKRAEEETARLSREHEASLGMVRDACQGKYEDCLDGAIAQCQEQYLSIVRECEQSEDTNATDDEDGVVPRPFTRDWETGQRKPLEERYQSRCWFQVESQKRWEITEQRIDFLERQKSYEPKSLKTNPGDFVVYDGEIRAASSASLNLLALIDASLEPPFDNESAIGLQALATAAGFARTHSEKSQNLDDQRTAPPRPPARILPLQTQPEAIQEPDDSFVPAFQDYDDQPHNGPITATHSSDILDAQRQEHAIGTGLPPTSRDHQPHYHTNPPAGVPFQNQAQSAEQPQAHPAIQATAAGPLHLQAVGPAHVEGQSRRGRKAPIFDIIMHQQPASEPQETQEQRPGNQEKPAENATQPSKPKERKRPGPRAIYVSNTLSGTKTAPSISRPPAQWSHFNNTMGPPVPFPPNYVRRTSAKESAYPPHPLAPTDVQSGPTQPRHRSASGQDDHTGVFRVSQPQIPEFRYENQRFLGPHYPPSTIGSYPEQTQQPPRQGPTPPPTVTTQPVQYYAPAPALDPSSQYRYDGWYGGQPPLAPRPPTTSAPEHLQSLPTLNRPLSPPTGYQQTYDRGPQYTPNYRYIGASIPPASAPAPAPSSAPAPSYQYNAQNQWPGPHHAERPRSRSPAITHQQQPSSLPEQQADIPIDPALRSPPRPPPPPPEFRHPQAPPHTALSPLAPPPGPPAGPPASHDNPETMGSIARHPGQRIGQQLLPATLDPSRNISGSAALQHQPQHNPHPQPQPHYHTHERSSSGSRAGWHVTDAPQSQPTVTSQPPQQVGSNVQATPMTPHGGENNTPIREYKAPPQWPTAQWPGFERTGQPPPSQSSAVPSAPHEMYFDRSAYPHVAPENPTGREQDTGAKTRRRRSSGPGRGGRRRRSSPNRGV